MRFQFILAAALVTLSSANAFAQQGSAVVDRGLKVYAAERCATCHAVAGKGNPKGPLDGVGSRLSADDIRRWIVNAPEMTAKAKAERKPAMRAYTTIQKDDLDALVAYLLSLKK